jgi:dihydroxyacetone kinase
MKHFINQRTNIVAEAIDTAVMLGEGKLARLDGYPAIKVVVRTDWDRSKVAVVSGGGGGHEPTHAGFVGEGMLTAAVCGEIFASPSVNAVLAGILAVTGEAGCLLVVKNYTGDRLNFGFAATKARAMGYKVEMVIVSDDIAIAGAPQPRGLAGTLFVHKVAGHLARAGAPLHVIKEAAERVATGVRTLGIAVSTGAMPGESAEIRLGPDEVELGLGIHGEPGAAKIPYRPIRELAATMVTRLDEALGQTQAPLALLINDLGSVTPLEMAVTTGAILSVIKREIALVFGGERLMTSLDMKGFSVSVLPLDDQILHALKSEVGPRAWVPGRAITKVAPLPLSSRMQVVAATPSENAARRRVVETVCHTLLELELTLNALDEKVGDGDAGTTFATAARAILADLDRFPFAEPAALCAAIADRLSTVMGGSSGILLSIGVSAMGATLVGDATPDWPAALLEGVHRIQHYGGAKAGDRTMIDALLPAATALNAGENLAAAAVAARRGADTTASMKIARAGRSSYVPEAALHGVPDPGAVAMASVFEALAALG